MTKLSDSAAEMQKIMGEINDLLVKSGVGPLRKDDEQGGIDDNAEGDPSKPMAMDGDENPAPDASGDASVQADDEAADGAAEDLGDMDGEGDDGMDGRDEVKQMVADMSDDELMLMLEVMQAESASRGAGQDGADAEDGAPEAPEAPEMDQGAPAPDMPPASDMAPPASDMAPPPAPEEDETLAPEMGKSDSQPPMLDPGGVAAMGRAFGKSDDGDKDDMKKSIQFLSDQVDALLAAQSAAPAPATKVVVVKPIASNRPQGQALEKSSSAPAVQKLAKSDAIQLLLEVQKREVNSAQKSVDYGMVSDLHRADEASAEKMIAGFQLRGILPK
jgi:hypothetical protein